MNVSCILVIRKKENSCKRNRVVIRVHHLNPQIAIYMNGTCTCIHDISYFSTPVSESLNKQ